MSIASKKRRKARRGGLAGHVQRMTARFAATERVRKTALTPEEHFAELVREGGRIAMHPDTAAKMRAALPTVIGASESMRSIEIIESAFIPVGTLVAMGKAPPIAPLSTFLDFRAKAPRVDDAEERRLRWYGGFGR